MPPSYKASLAAEDFQFNVKDHVVGNFLIANRRSLPIKEDPESNANILHFLSNGVSPKGVSILSVKLKGFLGGLGHFNTKFVGPFKISWILLFHKQDNPVPIFKDMRDLPVESWFVVDVNDFGIFGDLNGVGFLQINWVFSGQRAVLQLAA